MTTSSSMALQYSLLALTIGSTTMPMLPAPSQVCTWICLSASHWSWSASVIPHAHAWKCRYSIEVVAGRYLLTCVQQVIALLHAALLDHMLQCHACTSLIPGLTTDWCSTKCRQQIMQCILTCCNNMSHMHLSCVHGL